MTDLFILGADDPEMSAIASLLRECGIPYAYAVDAAGNRVHPGSAYRAVVWLTSAGYYCDRCGLCEASVDGLCPHCDADADGDD